MVTDAQPPNLRVLILDPDEQITESLVTFLSGRGVQATACRDVDTALGHVQRYGSDVVLIDPGAPRWEALARVHTPLPGRRFLVLMAELTSLPRGARVLAKPFTGRALLNLLRTLQAEVPEPRLSPPTHGAPPAAAGEAPPAGRERYSPFGAEPVVPPAAPRLDAVAGGAPSDPDVRPDPVHARRPRGDFARQTFTTDLYQVGSLAEVSIAELLYKLFAKKATGRLELLWRDQQRAVFFHEGVPVYAKSDAPSEQVESVLITLGFLNLGALQRARRHQGNRPLVDVLLDFDLITPEQLMIALDRQIAERVLNLFALHEGRFVFRADSDGGESIQRFPQNPIELIFEGIKRHVSPNLIAQSLSDSLDLYVVPTSRFEAFRPFVPTTLPAYGLLDQIDGHLRLKELTQLAAGQMFDLLALVWSLKQARMVGLTAEPAAPVSEEPTHATPPPPPSSDRIRSVLANEGFAPATRSLSKRVLVYCLRLDQPDPAALLGVAPDADSATIRKAFHDALDAIRPKPGERLADELQRKADQVERALRTAYDQLIYARPSGPTRRPSPPEPQPQPAAPNAAARERARMAPAGARYADPNLLPAAQRREDEVTTDPLDDARQAIVSKRWEAAMRALDRLSEEQAQAPYATILKAWILFHMPYRDRARLIKACQERIQLALTLDPNIVEGYYFLGRIAEESNQREQAAQHYRRTLERSPGFIDAQRRLDALAGNPTPEPADDRAGLFGRLKGWMDK